MTNSGPTFVLIVLAVCLAVANVAAQPIHLIDIPFKSLQQLDDALAAGEISEEEYLLLLPLLLRTGEIGADSSEEMGEYVAIETEKEDVAIPVEYRFRSDLSQELEEDYGSIRYDRLDIEWRGLRLKISAEKRDDRELLIRSRSIGLRLPAGNITLGSFSTARGLGVTLGRATYQRELNSREDFTGSVSYPVQNRCNGFLAEIAQGNAETFFMASRLRGEEHALAAVATGLEIGERGSSLGILLLRQKLSGPQRARSQRDFLGTYFEVRRGSLNLAAESSLGLGTSGANVIRFGWRKDGNALILTLFSYSNDYRNLFAGGFAYSDYESIKIDDLNFSYRSKHSGRTGLATSSTVKLTDQSRLKLDLIRWQHRGAGRQCAAAAAHVHKSDFIRQGGRLKFSAMWDNLDPGGNGVSRKILSLSLSLPLSEAASLRSYQRVERRVDNQSKRIPLRCRIGADFRSSHWLDLGLEVNYYDPNLLTKLDSYLYLTVTQAVLGDSGMGFRLAGRVRYLERDRYFSGWEIRLSCHLSG